MCSPSMVSSGEPNSRVCDIVFLKGFCATIFYAMLKRCLKRANKPCVRVFHQYWVLLWRLFIYLRKKNFLYARSGIYTRFMVQSSRTTALMMGGGWK